MRTCALEGPTRAITSRIDFIAGDSAIRIGEVAYAELEPYRGATGGATTLSDTVFSTVPGAPVFVGKAPKYRAKNKALGIDVNIQGYNALQSIFKFDA